MADNNEKPIGTGTGFTLPGTAVREFAEDTMGYVMLDLDRTVSRLPLINNSAINIAKGIPEMSSLIMAGRFGGRFIKDDIDEYEAIVVGLKEKEVVMGTYLEYQNKMLTAHHDVDYATGLLDKSLAREEETDYRNNKKTEFLKQLNKTFQASSMKTYPDMHTDSIFFDKRLKEMHRDAEEKRIRNEEEYAKFIELKDKIVKPILDERATKKVVPVVLYMSEKIDPELREIIDGKIERGALRTRETWDNTTWADAMGSLEKLFQKQHDEELIKIQEEVKSGLYGMVSMPEVSKVVLQKLGFFKTL